MMDAVGIQALIALGNKNAVYLAGNSHMTRWELSEDSPALLIPVVALPDKSFVIGGYSKESELPGEHYDCEQVVEARLDLLIEQLKARNLDESTIGIDMDTAPARPLLLLGERLPGARFVPADGILARMRSVKSPQELECIKKAVSIGEEAFQEVATLLHEGVAYRDIAIAWAMAVHKREGVPFCCLPYDFLLQTRLMQISAESGGRSRYPTHAERDCVTRLDICCVYKGYWSDHKIVICVGQPDGETLQMYEEHRARQEFMRSLIRPGMTKTEVHQTCMSEFKHLDRHPFWIHGIGLDAHEEPRLGSPLPYAVNIKPEVTFEVGAVLALEPSWLVEDDYVLQADGFERLGELPQRILTF